MPGPDDRRVDAHLVVGGKYHDMDYARLQLLQHLAADERIRTTVGNDFEDVERLRRSTFLVSYTCDVRPSLAAQEALRDWMAAGGRWFALHSTNAFLDPPPALGEGPFTAVDACPTMSEVLGSRFLSHPAMGPYRVWVAPGAEDDPLVAGLHDFEAGHDELYLSTFTADIETLLETRWHGSDATTRGFADSEWPDDDPRPVLYRRPLGQGAVLYLTLGHCRSTWDMVDPPFTGAPYPRIERGSWEIDEYHELLRRGLAWASGLVAVAP